MGIVYGDLGTSPLYVYSSTFSNGIKHKDDVLGVLSLVFYTLTLLPLIKYVFIVLQATDNGEVLSAVGAVKEATSALTQVSMCSMVYPVLILAYTGQSAYLRQHPDSASDAFFESVPAMISGTFSVVHQSLSLGCFSRVKVVHTSANYEGQVYIPKINYFLMLACVGVIFGFKTTVKVGNAYGITVVFVMTLTSALLVLIMILIWKINIFLIILYVVIIRFVELMYLSSVLYKFTLRGYLPLAFSAFLMIVMYVWNNVYRRKYYYELDHMISTARLTEIFTNKNMSRIPGLVMFYSELVQGIPPIFEHYVSNCAVRYGYNDVREVAFEETLITRLKEFIQEEAWMQIQTLSIGGKMSETGKELDREIEHNEILKAKQAKEEKLQEIMEQEIEQVEKAWEEVGIVHLIGQNEVIASKGSNMMKRILIDYAYNLLKRNLRQSEAVFDIPHKRMLKVGMTYQL
ncbi:hypothetical protein J1N35_021036 [Gossypium stocksii]|uniref:Potassium transporter n=1 Tax=Gossypium stocksii TaxID=47602 RepID=A0A9D3VDN7_9ROSI|nr:hypothetical protein J1N35_021036 [Gossypium stocksii]